MTSKLRNNNSVISTSKYQNKKSQTLYTIACILLVLIIWFSLPSFVGSVHTKNSNSFFTIQKRYCKNGFRNTTDGECSCDRLHYGPNCEFLYCPMNTPWIDIPTQDHQRPTKPIPCSNQGICDPTTGTCRCRDGYEGRACERLACPRIGFESTSFLNPYIFKVYSVDTGDYNVRPADFNTVPPCSGHGRCKTLRDAGSEFDGNKLIRPPVNYMNWDADKIQGCLCDRGYSGYHCFYPSCLQGPDPLQSQFDKSEIITLQCQANQGYFVMKVMGYDTFPLPWDADVALVKYALEQLVTIGKVTVNMDVMTSNNNTPTVCSPSFIQSTTIQFLDYTTQSIPPLLLFWNVTLPIATRQWGSRSQQSLSLNSNTPIIRLASIYKLSCSLCNTNPCEEDYLYFQYGQSISNPISVSDDVMSGNIIRSSIMSLSDLINQGWTNLNVEVTSSSSSICSSTSSNEMFINIYSDYGNIPGLAIIFASQNHNITMTDNKGNSTLYECSNQGICDRTSGTCNCLSYYVNSTKQYYATSSNGRRGPGTRNDCGYIAKAIPSCGISSQYGKLPCNGHGKCSHLTDKCECFEGWFGLTCEITSCPQGPALFDEPWSQSKAHQLAECSNNGICNRLSGLCQCRDGFIGQACEVRDCIRSTETSEACNGRGSCLSIAQIYKNYGFSYGSKYNKNLYPSTWDAEIWYECVCAAKTSSGFFGNPLLPLIGPKANISGMEAMGDPLNGFSGYDCSQWNCPKGDNTNTRTNYGNDLEVQHIICNLSQYSIYSFQLLIYNETTEPILPSFGIYELKQALESLKSIGFVDVFRVNSSSSITTLCSQEDDSYGFFIRFTTELGDIPLLQVISNNHEILMNISIIEKIKGSQLNLECGGPLMGICDHSRGVCLCSSNHLSSNGTNQSIGNKGECGYYSSIQSTYQIQTDGSIS